MAPYSNARSNVKFSLALRFPKFLPFTQFKITGMSLQTSKLVIRQYTYKILFINENCIYGPENVIKLPY